MQSIKFINFAHLDDQNLSILHVQLFQIINFAHVLDQNYPFHARICFKLSILRMRLISIYLAHAIDQNDRFRTSA